MTLAAYREMFAGGPDRQVEYRLRSASGAWVWVRDRVRIVRTPDGRPYRLRGVLVDVTASREAEARLRDSEALMRAMAEGLPDAFYMLDARTGETLYVNTAYESLWGAGPESLKTSPRAWLEAVHPDDRGRVEGMLAESRRGIVPPPWELEYRVVRPDGSVHWIWHRRFAVRDRAGEDFRILGIAHDVTDRRAAEDALRALLRVTWELTSTLDADDLLDVLVQETLPLVAAEGGCAGLRTPEGMAARRRFTRDGPIDVDLRWRDGEGLPGWVAVQRVPVMVNDAASEPRIRPDDRDRFGIRSAVCVPLLDALGDAIGFLQVDNKSGGVPFTSWDLEKLMAVAQAASVAIQNALAYQKLRDLSGRLLQSQTEERRRIARELHDSTAQNLAALGMNLAVVDRSAHALAGAERRRLRDSLRLAEECCREIRTLSYLLHPPALEETDFWSAVRWFTEGFSHRSGIRVDLRLPPAREPLPEEVETTLFRIVQESLTNIHRHSGSKRARIRMAREDSRITLEVQDEGRGMPEWPPEEDGPARLGVGIAGMRERVRLLGGTLEIGSSGRGTRVQVTLPLSAGN